MKNPPRLKKINARIPVDLETVIHKAIAHEPARRYATPRRWRTNCTDSARRAGSGTPHRAARPRLQVGQASSLADDLGFTFASSPRRPWPAFFTGTTFSFAPRSPAPRQKTPNRAAIIKRLARPSRRCSAVFTISDPRRSATYGTAKRTPRRRPGLLRPNLERGRIERSGRPRRYRSCAQ